MTSTVIRKCSMHTGHGGWHYATVRDINGVQIFRSNTGTYETVREEVETLLYSWLRQWNQLRAHNGQESEDLHIQWEDAE